MRNMVYLNMNSRLYMRFRSVCSKYFLHYRFFTIQDHPESLLLVNRNFNQRLQRKIGKFYLLHPTILYCEQNEKLRNSFIMRFFKLQQSDIDYV